MKDKNPSAVSLGQLGGRKTLEKYGKDRLKEWGKKGGRPIVPKSYVYFGDKEIEVKASSKLEALYKIREMIKMDTSLKEIYGKIVKLDNFLN